MSPLSTDVLTAIDRAAQQLPLLRIVDHPDCDGHAWITDPATATAYVRRAEACVWSTHLMDALDDLCRRCGVPGIRPSLRLVRGGGQSTTGRDHRTGTDGG